MKKTMIYLNNMKSRCFMLVACVILVWGVTSCHSDDFESIVPDGQKELSKAELIEQALSRIPQTRADAPFPVVMVTTKTTVSIGCRATEDMVINWGDEETTSIPKGNYFEHTHTYSDNQPRYGIYLEGSNEALTYLNVSSNGLMFLEVTNNTNLSSLLCENNDLDNLDLTGCPNLESVWATANNLSSIDLTHLPHLRILGLYDNQITNIDLSKNTELEEFSIGGNSITDLDLTKNTALWHISMRELSIKTINNLPISDRSFAVFPKLKRLNISGTPFTSLDLSNNPLVNDLSIPGTAITQLDMSNLQIESLDAKNSQLTNLIYTKNNLQHATFLKIEGTPFEKLSSNLYPFITALPDRSLPDEFGRVKQGALLTTSSALVAPLLSYLTAKNWEVYPK